LGRPDIEIETVLRCRPTFRFGGSDWSQPAWAKTPGAGCSPRNFARYPRAVWPVLSSFQYACPRLDGLRLAPTKGADWRRSIGDTLKYRTAQPWQQPSLYLPTGHGDSRSGFLPKGTRRRRDST
jgi:hypothetical protein